MSHRRIFKIKLINNVSNAEVLERIRKEKEMLNTIKIRNLQYPGHMMKGEKYTMLQIIILSEKQVKRNRGRRYISWLNRLRQWYKSSSFELFRAIASKIKMALMIYNLLKGDGT